MKLKIIALISLAILFLRWPKQAIAIVDSLAVPNNKLGVHLLDPNELALAAKLVNGSDGSWGYVTVPIQAGDRNRDKWTAFMKAALELKVIPIVRVATVAQGSNWAEPNNYDLVDFANFLSDLPWPTKNRYVIIFNEVNRADEYGGFVSPEHYADILINAISIFKARNDDFFILPAGLDDAANNKASSLRWRDYLRRMQQAQPDIFNKIDGWTSHSYPNPDFVGSPWDTHDHSVVSFRHELKYISQFTSKKLPVFITETGWDMRSVSSDRVSAFYQYAFNSVWNDPQIVAVTPFLLRAGAGPFLKFSLLDRSDQQGVVYKTLQSLAVKGQPVLGKIEVENTQLEALPAPTFEAAPLATNQFGGLKQIWEWLTHLLFGQSTLNNLPTKPITVGDKEFTVEIADTPAARQQGLSDRSALENNKGMLFVFDTPSYYTFWMHNMRFDLDIVWLYNDTVIAISRGDHTDPDRTIDPPGQIDKVLEVNPDSGIKIGDKLKFK